MSRLIHVWSIWSCYGLSLAFDSYNVGVWSMRFGHSVQALHLLLVIILLLFFFLVAWHCNGLGPRQIPPFSSFHCQYSGRVRCSL